MLNRNIPNIPGQRFRNASDVYIGCAATTCVRVLEYHRTSLSGEIPLPCTGVSNFSRRQLRMHYSTDSIVWGFLIWSHDHCNSFPVKGATSTNPFHLRLESRPLLIFVMAKKSRTQQAPTRRSQTEVNCGTRFQKGTVKMNFSSERGTIERISNKTSQIKVQYYDRTSVCCPCDDSACRRAVKVCRYGKCRDRSSKFVHCGKS